MPQSTVPPPAADVASPQQPSMAVSGEARRTIAIATASAGLILLHLLLLWSGTRRFVGPIPLPQVPLLIGLALGGIPLLWQLIRQALRAEFGADFLAGLAIGTAALQGEYLAGLIVVLMLSGGQTLEIFAMRKASSVLEALARRIPAIAHRRRDQQLIDIPLEAIRVGDELTVLPHEVCPVDGTVLEGRGTMDESYLTGEPYQIAKVPGAAVLSGAVNGAAALTIRVERLPIDSRYAKIMGVMREAEQRRPRMRRIADQLGGWYTPLAVGVAALAWLLSGESTRFLAVLVVATPCPLLIAIPVALIGGISLAARRGIIIRDPAVLERIDECRVAIFDKTGTLTYGRPSLIESVPLAGSLVDAASTLRLAAALEQYSKHPLADAILRAARERKVTIPEASEVAEPPGRGLTGRVEGHDVEVTGRAKLLRKETVTEKDLPPPATGLECVVLVDGHPAALFRFRDAPRRDSRLFLAHLPRHRFARVLLVSGDREVEARDLAASVGIKEVYADQTPEQKLELVRRETALAPTLYMGDGINDAPALTAATVGIAFGQGDVTAEAAGAVVLEHSLEKVDEFLHIGRRMRRIALQSALGGMALSILGMLFAATGHLPPVAGALFQEAIDVLAVLNALRAGRTPGSGGLNDYEGSEP